MKHNSYSSPCTETRDIALECVITASGDPEDMIWLSSDNDDEIDIR